VFYKKAVGPERDLQQNKKEVFTFDSKKYAKTVKRRNRMRKSKINAEKKSTHPLLSKQSINEI
jgi:hypothetical protein